MLAPRFITLITFLIFSIYSFAQSENIYVSNLVPTELMTDVNAVIRYDSKIIEINGFDDMVVYSKRIITVYNKYGDKHINAVEFYDKNTNIKKIEARIYDALGKEIKKIKKNDFLDESAVSGGTLYSDNRVKYFEYTPISYPYTIEFLSEVKYKSTAFVPKWRPVNGYFLGVEFSEYKIVNNSDIKIRKKLFNVNNYNIEEVSKNHFVVKNLHGIKYEKYSPSLSSFTPILKVAMSEFNMEGVPGVNNNWVDFGKWMHDYLLIDTNELPLEVVNEVKTLTKDVTSKIERAKIVYKYMQDKTRYISVQVGIGGWKPMMAKDVDRLGYGDCKGLSNYTKALLEAVEVPSYYTVVYGGENLRSIDSDFSVTEGNHVILCVPYKNDNIFLECTSQTMPFGFIAGFTDDRDALLIKPDGGEIVHTKVYGVDDSVQQTFANVQLDDLGNIVVANVKITSTGFQYKIHEKIENKTLSEQNLYYKGYWNNINDIKIESIDVVNDKDSIIFNELIKLSSLKYASKTGSRIIFQPNMFNRITSVPPRYIKRETEFKIDRSFKDIDEFIIQIPKGFEIEAMVGGESLETKFGSYSFDIEYIKGEKIKYTRKFILNKGNYSKEEYKAFRDFQKQIVKYDKAKVALIKL